jgi:hypothetical protein
MPMSVHDALEAWSEGRLSTEQALSLTGCADVAELLGACDSSDVERPRDDWHARRATLKARDAALDAGRESMPARGGPADEATIEAEAVAACRAPSAVRWSVEDTGCSSRVELRVSVLVGTKRSTVIVADPITGRAHFHGVVPHGSETASAAEAVRALIGARVDLKPATVGGAIPEPLGERGE